MIVLITFQNTLRRNPQDVRQTAETASWIKHKDNPDQIPIIVGEFRDDLKDFLSSVKP